MVLPTQVALGHGGISALEDFQNKTVEILWHRLDTCYPPVGQENRLTGGLT